MQDDVDAAHVLPVEGAEIVPAAAAEARVRVHVFDDMADVLYPVRRAPRAELTGERVPVELRHRVHVGVPDLSGIGTDPEPKPGEVRRRVVSEELCHHAGDAVVPRQGEPRHSDAAVVHAPVDRVRTEPGIAERGLVREETGDRRAEILRVMRVVTLVHRVDQHPDGLLAEHVYVVRVARSLAGLVEEEHAPAPRGDRETQKSVLHAVRQPDRLGRAVLEDLALVGRDAAAGINVEQDVLFIHRIRHEQRVVQRSHHVDVALDELPVSQLGMEFLDVPGGVTGREVVVVEDPDLHPALLCLREDEIHVAPPALAHEIAVRPGLHAERAASAFVNPLHLFRDGRGVVAVLPVEGEYIVFFPAGEHVVQPLVCHVFSSCAIRRARNCRTGWKCFGSFVPFYPKTRKNAREFVRFRTETAGFSFVLSAFAS